MPVTLERLEAEFAQQSALEQGEPSVALATCILSEEELDTLVLSERRPLLGEWFKAGDLGYIFGKRGNGKTWIGQLIARALVEGGNCGPWKAHTPCRVMYVDGEMPPDQLRSRNQSLRERRGELMYISHQVVFDRAHKAICLSDPVQQVELTAFCEENNIDVLILDNIACLFRGIEENSADHWRDHIENWLLELRRRGIAVIIIAHSGRNTSTMRGTSKREDAAFWIIRVDEASGSDTDNGARFVTRFVKNRNSANDPLTLEWNIRPDGERVLVTYRHADNLDVFRQWIEDGLETCSDIAQEMGLSKGQVSKLAKKAENAGWLRKRGRRYEVIADP